MADLEFTDQIPPPSTHMFRVSEDDLETLESELPRLLSDSMLSCNNPLTRKRWEIVKQIVSNVRWDYGPPSNVGVIPAGDQQ